MSSDLWVEKYRPTSVDNYLFADLGIRNKVLGWIQDGQIPHLLIHGPPGTGKSSLASVLLRALHIQDGDLLYINASEENSIDTVRTKILTFAQSMPYGLFKVVLLEEADRMSAGQDALKRVLEDYAATCRFIITTNHRQKIIPAIASRCQEIQLSCHSLEACLERSLEILLQEGVELNDEDLSNVEKYVRAHMPDLRKIINTLQLRTANGKLLPPSEEGFSTRYLVDVVELFRQNRILEARNLFVKNATDADYLELYRFLYRNVDCLTEDPDKQRAAVIIIAEHLYRAAFVADQEINFSACIYRIMNAFGESDQ
jgi:DNA polymerase III delta prime subunit